MKNAVFGKFKPESIRAQVTREIERKIFSGELAVGERLPPERDLAERLGVSRSLVNLAILDLESMGFLRIVPRQGTFVADYKTQSTPQMLLSLMMNGTADNTGADLFISMLETRRLLESECARLAALNASEDDLEKLSSILEEMRTAPDPAHFSDANFRFHRALMAASGNIVYAMIFQSFQKVVLFYVTRYFTTKERIRLSLEQHEALLAALKARDEERSLREVRVIMEEGISSLTKMFAPNGAKNKKTSDPRA